MKYNVPAKLNNKPGVYKITNLVDGKIYIGSAIRFRERYRKHFNSLKNNTHCNKHLKAAVQKYGIDNFSFEVVESTSLEQRKSREQELIFELKTFNDTVGYNLKCETGTEAVYTKELRDSFREGGRKAGAMSREKYKDPEYRRAFAEHMRSIPKSEEHLAKIRENGAKYNKNSMKFKTLVEFCEFIEVYVAGASMTKLSEEYQLSTSAISRIFQKPYPPLYQEFMTKIQFEGDSIKDLRKPEIQAKLQLTQD
jgi:group I intron endonuclease